MVSSTWPLRCPYHSGVACGGSECDIIAYSFSSDEPRRYEGGRDIRNVFQYAVRLHPWAISRPLKVIVEAVQKGDKSRRSFTRKGKVVDPPSGGLCRVMFLTDFVYYHLQNGRGNPIWTPHFVKSCCERTWNPKELRSNVTNRVEMPFATSLAWVTGVTGDRAKDADTLHRSLGLATRSDTTPRAGHLPEWSRQLVRLDYPKLNGSEVRVPTAVDAGCTPEWAPPEDNPPSGFTRHLKDDTRQAPEWTHEPFPANQLVRAERVRGEVTAAARAYVGIRRRLWSARGHVRR